MMNPTSAFDAFAVEPFPTIQPGDNLADAILTALTGQSAALQDGDIIVVASKVVSIAEKRYVDLTTITPSAEAHDLAERTGKPATLTQLILDASTTHFLATPSGPIIAHHNLGYQLTSAGIDRAGTNGAWLLPADPDASARDLRNALTAATGVTTAIVIADSDGRADRRGSTAISIGAAGINPLRTSHHTDNDGHTKAQEEAITDLIAAAAGIILGQRGRGAPVAIVRGISYQTSDDGVTAILHSPGHP